MERHEIFLGTCSMMYVSLLGATLAWHSVNDGRYATIYYAPDAYGWSWFFIQFAVIFVWQVVTHLTRANMINTVIAKYSMHRIMGRIGRIASTTHPISTNISTSCITRTSSQRRFQSPPFIPSKLCTCSRCCSRQRSYFPFIGVSSKRSTADDFWFIKF